MLSRLSNARGMPSLVMAAACWGIGAVLSKAALAHIPPLTLLVVQLTASLAVLWPLFRLQNAPVPWNRRLVSLGLLGLLNPGISYTLSLVGLSLTTASMSALLWAAEPLLIIALAWLLLRERQSARFLFFSALAIGGVSLAIGANLGQPGQLVGNGLILAGVLCCALYTVLARRTSSEYSPLLAVALQEGLALGWALLIWPAEMSHTALAGLRQIPIEAWALAALSGVVYYGLAFWFYLRGLRQVSAGQAGLYINLVPIFALAGAYLLLAERLALLQWLGCGLILAGVFGLSLGQQFRRVEATS